MKLKQASLQQFIFKYRDTTYKSFKVHNVYLKKEKWVWMECYFFTNYVETIDRLYLLSCICSTKSRSLISTNYFTDTKLSYQQKNFSIFRIKFMALIPYLITRLIHWPGAYTSHCFRWSHCKSMCLCAYFVDSASVCVCVPEWTWTSGGTYQTSFVTVTKQCQYQWWLALANKERRFTDGGVVIIKSIRRCPALHLLSCVSETTDWVLSPSFLCYWSPVPNDVSNILPR